MRGDEIEAKFIARVKPVSPYAFRRVPLDAVRFSGTKEASRNSRTGLGVTQPVEDNHMRASISEPPSAATQNSTDGAVERTTRAAFLLREALARSSLAARVL